MSRADRSYKDLKQKKKSAIADKTYRMYLKFYLVNLMFWRMTIENRWVFTTSF